LRGRVFNWVLTGHFPDRFVLRSSGPARPMLHLMHHPERLLMGVFVQSVASDASMVQILRQCSCV